MFRLGTMSTHPADFPKFLGEPTVVDFFRESEVYKLQMALRVNQDVLRLHIAVRDTFEIMEEFKY